jgi:hypothetical protein
MADYSKDKKQLEAQIRGMQAQLTSALEDGNKKVAASCASELEGLKAKLASVKSNERSRP